MLQKNTAEQIAVKMQEIAARCIRGFRNTKMAQRNDSMYTKIQNGATKQVSEEKGDEVFLLFVAQLV